MVLLQLYCIIIIQFAAILCLSCSSVTKPANAGLVTANIFFFDSVAQDFVYAPNYWPGCKIWFRDSTVIEQLSQINIEQNQDGFEKRDVTVSKYIYIDLRKKSFYEYSSFSDTAVLLAKYIQPDSVSVIGGWNFYYSKSLEPRSYTLLSDTTIEGITYKRLHIDNLFGVEGHTTIGYLRCDKIGSLFQYDKMFGKKLGCPIVRLDDVAMPKKQTLLSRRIIFEREYLTSIEKRVFNAWEKNAKENPVKK